MANYLTFSSPGSFTLATANAAKNWDGTLEYSTDTSTWNVWDGTTTLSADEGKLYLRGTGNTKITGYPAALGGKWDLIGSNIACVGNIENLLDYEAVANGEHPKMAGWCYVYMFTNCTSLTKAPELPATQLSSQCYACMFSGCRNLIEAPALPATTLKNFCYSFMFRNCTSLIKAPALPATTLTTNCYEYMFDYCLSLIKPPALPAMTLANGCYRRMFADCKSLTRLPALPATTLAPECYYEMFFGCTLIKVSATQNEEYKIPYRIPANGDGTTATDACRSMIGDSGGTFQVTPSINTTYYTSNEVIYVDEEEPTATVITYDGKTIATLEAGQMATIKTAETEVEHDIVVKAGSGGGVSSNYGKITYNQDKSIIVS